MPKRVHNEGMTNNNKTTIVLSLETYRAVYAPRDAKYTVARCEFTKARIQARAQTVANETQNDVDVVAPKSQGGRLLATFNPCKPVRS